MMWKTFLCLCVFLFGVSYVASDEPPTNLCPNSEDILPCRCNFPSYYLVCQDIKDVKTLRRVANNLEGVQTEFSKILVINSSLQYLPSEILEKVNVYELHLINVSLKKAFEKPPTPQDLFQVIRFDNVKLRRGVIWTLFKNMSHLKTLMISNISVPTLGKDFKDNVPHGLRQLELYQTKTKKFEIGVFNDFKSLEKIDVNHCKLEELHRDYFPVPFNIKAMYFGNNKIKSIPADLFTDMPMLKDITLYGNQIATVPESAFGGRYDKLEMFRISENPLKCDCSLKWIVRWKPFLFDGTCAFPKVMHGKELQSLTTHDFPRC